MWIEQAPLLYQGLYSSAHWRIPSSDERVAYITFDDGPIPEVTPWVLDVLDNYGVKATFFCVGDNVRKHPAIFEEVRQRGHAVGNHTFNHVQGWLTKTSAFMANVRKASELIPSKLFRPPHGHLVFPQPARIRQAGYKLIMWDVVTRDYNAKVSPQQVLNNVKRYTRNGSIIVFHDSLKAERNLRYALPKAIEWLLAEGYRLERIDEEKL